MTLTVTTIPKDASFIPLYNLQQVIIDKATGTPLGGGIVTFYKDSARDVKKSVFRISGQAPDYQMVELPNPLVLSATGTFVDESGNDIAVYARPYDSIGTVDLYYITFDSGIIIDNIPQPAVPQFTRESVPYITSQSPDTVSAEFNFIPNGQFTVHYDIPASENNDWEVGRVDKDYIVLGPGEWSFERDTASTAVNKVSFSQDILITDEDCDPGWLGRVQCVSPMVGSLKQDLNITFGDVRKFSSSDNLPQLYSLTFSCLSNTVAGTTIAIFIKHDYDSVETNDEIQVGTLLIGTVFENYTVSFQLPVIPDSTIVGINSKLSFTLRFPLESSYDYTLRNFSLIKGNVAPTSYPTQPEEVAIARSMSYSLPQPVPDGYNLYIPEIQTREGKYYDFSVIGSYEWSDRIVVPPGRFMMSGQTIDYYATSPEGIPYSRLYDLVWGDPTTGIAIYGQGTDSTYATATILSTGIVKLTYMQFGTPPSPPIYDSTSNPTGFTFTGLGTNPQSYSIAVLAGFSITPGSWFEFKTVNLKHYYVYFIKDDIGDRPIISGALPIKVNILTSDDAATVATKLRKAINGKYYYVPDRRGMFLRNWANGSSNDPDRSSRANRGDGFFGDVVGTTQSDIFESHMHPLSYILQVSNALQDGSLGWLSGIPNIYTNDTHLGFQNLNGLSISMSAVGGNETRPLNYYENCFVRF